MYLNKFRPLCQLEPFVEYIQAMQQQPYVIEEDGEALLVARSDGAVLKCIYGPSTWDVGVIRVVTEHIWKNQLLGRFSAFPLTPYDEGVMRGLDWLRFRGGTYIVDLEDDDWKPNKKVRQNVRRLKKAGIEVREIFAVEEFQKYWEIYLTNRKELGLLPWPVGCFNTIMWWVNNKPELAYTLAAFKDNEMIAAMSFLCGEGWVDEVHVGQLVQPKLYPEEGLRVKAIKTARERGHKYYDLGGVTPNAPPGSKEANLERYKKKFNGAYKESDTWIIGKIIKLNDGFRVESGDGRAAVNVTHRD